MKHPASRTSLRLSHDRSTRVERLMAWKLPFEPCLSSGLYTNDTAEKKVRTASACNQVQNQWLMRECLARDAFEACTGHTFPKVRPRFLKNPNTGRNLELDGYCEALSLGWEVDGAQHVTYPNAFHRTPEEFHAQQVRDQIKNELCKQAGVTLIRIPHDIETDAIENYVKDQLHKHGAH